MGGTSTDVSVNQSNFYKFKRYDGKSFEHIFDC
jgi:hypothetical protein